jgi:ribosomal protein S27E
MTGPRNTRLRKDTMNTNPTYIEIRCLGCGTARLKLQSHRASAMGCPSCGYLGWTFAAAPR